MSGFNDSTLGFQAIGFVGTAKMELHKIDVSNEVDSGFTVPSTLVNLLGWVGNGCFSLGCVSGSMAPPITNVSLCAGPVLEVSIGDASDDASDDENSKAVLIAWGW